MADKLTEIYVRKASIVKVLLNTYLIIAIISVFLTTFNLIDGHSRPIAKIYCVLTYGVCIFILILIKVLNQNNYKNIYLLLLLVTSGIAMLLNITDGPIYPELYLLITLMIITSSIVFSFKFSALYSLVIILSFIIISYIKILKSINIFGDHPEFGWGNFVLYIILIATIGYVVQIAYSQIDHSYKKAIEYAKELELLNKELDNKVILRTKQLENSFQTQVDSLHSTAVIGGITQSLLHDIATPISSLRGVFNIIDMESMDNDEKQMFQYGNEAVEQIIRIINNGKDLISGKIIKADFYPHQIIAMAIFVIQSTLNREGINIKINLSKKLKLKGNPSLFERIIVNLLLNSIEELKQISTRRQISISGKLENTEFILTIKDTGRGIGRENWDKIFIPGFSLKENRKNLGFGLPFVKNILEKEFKGGITIDSVENQYTEFNLIFPGYINEQAD